MSMAGKEFTLAISFALTCAGVLAPLLSMEASGASISWNTDTVLSGVQNFNGDVITLDGNLTITGTVSFTNTELKMVSPDNATHVIVVISGASFNVLGGSKIRSADPDIHYLFQVRPNSTLVMNDSGLHDCGYDDVVNWTQSQNSDRGLYIDSSSVCITNCTITGNNAGIVIDNATAPYIYNNNISQNDASGIDVLGSSTPIIDHNRISANLLNCIAWTAGGISSDSSSPVITNNVISDNNDQSFGWMAYGIYLVTSGNPTIMYNNITGHRDISGWGMGYGIFSDGNSATIARNNITDNDNGVYLGWGSCTVENNLISENDNQNSGFGLQDSSSSSSANNTYSKNVYGAFFSDSSGSSFTNDTFVQNTMAGIEGDSWGNAFSDTLTNCTWAQNPWDISFTAPQGGATGGTVTVITPTYTANKVRVTDAGVTLTVRWVMGALVLYENGSIPVDGANVNFTNAKNVDVAQAMTDANGWTELSLFDEFVYNGANKVMKSPYKVTAQKGGRANTTANVVLDRSRNATVILDDIAPWVTIQSPSNNTLTNKSWITVRGICEPGVTLFVNGEQVPAGSGDWSTQVTLAGDGPNDISVNVVDAAQNPAFAQITVFRDTVFPAIELTSPKDNFLTNRFSIPVTGTTTDTTAEVTVNGEATSVDAEGKFSFACNLTEGVNRIEVRCRDSANNSFSVLRTGERDSIAPELGIQWPQSGHLTNASTVTVRGVIEQGAVLTINNRTSSAVNGAFQAALDLVEGANSYVFAAKDKAGNINTTTLLVQRDSSPPSLAISSPVENARFNTSAVTVKGRTEAGATVKINGEKIAFEGTDFNVSVQLSAQGKNIITVWTADGLGNAVENSIGIFIDTVFPELKITAPVNRSITSQMSVELRGKTEPGAIVKVNGNRATVDASGVFSSSVSLDNEGLNTIRVTASDAVFNTIESSVTVTRDTIVEYNISKPSEGFKSRYKNVTVSGMAEKGATVKVGSQEAVLRPDGTFSLEMVLGTGPNTINITITDKIGNVVIHSINGSVTKPGPVPGPAKGFIPGYGAVTFVAAAAAACSLIVYFRRKD